MNRFSIFIILLLVFVSLAACSNPQAAPTQPTPPAPTQENQPAASNSPVQPGEETQPTTPTSVSSTEEVEITHLVAGFGKQLQLVSLLSPTASQDIETYYSAFVSPALLETWKKDVSKAPGRLVSSPWPDRIEITRLEKTSPNQYTVIGFIVEVTNSQALTTTTAARIPVQLTVQKTQSHWLIADYKEER